MSLQANLVRAEIAAEYANSLLRGRACNRSEDITHQLLQTLYPKFDKIKDREDRIDRMKIELNKDNFALNWGPIKQDLFGRIEDARTRRNATGMRLSSNAIIRDGIGNCFEHAVLACKYLKTKKISSYLAETDETINHAFVLIGADQGFGGLPFEVTRTDWGYLDQGMTVVCDPWYHEWFGVQQDNGRRMWHIFSTTTKEEDHKVPEKVVLSLTDGAAVW